MKYGFCKLALCTPIVKPGAPLSNVQHIKNCIDKAVKKGAEVIAFGKDSLVGATCGSMLSYAQLTEGVSLALDELCKIKNATFIVGAPLRLSGGIVSCAILFSRGIPVAVIPETDIECETVICGYTVPCNKNLVFNSPSIGGKFGVIVGEDFDRPYPYAARLAEGGAALIINISAAFALIDSFYIHSAKTALASEKYICGYAYISTGFGEAVGENVYCGDKIICEHFATLASDEGDACDTVISEVDVDGMNSYRRIKNFVLRGGEVAEVDVIQIDGKLTRDIPRLPFVPSTGEYSRIWDILGRGVYTRMLEAQTDKIILGLSGGLDSAVALLIAHKLFTKYSLPTKNIISVTMRSRHSSSRTNLNAQKLTKALDVTGMEIPISDAVNLHLKDINHVGKEDTTYENAQARERAQILLDLANKHRALMLGTSDLSEIALGWSTFGGDQTAHYNPNAGMAKTLIRAIIRNYVLTENNAEAAEVLNDILLTPVSPELKKNQETESVLGPYELNDFFLYYLIGKGYTVEKTLYLSVIAFPQFDREMIKRTMRRFIERFFANQFKRSASCDGIQLSPFDLTGKLIYSEFSGDLWLAALDKTDMNKL